jgi:hypothetical protein
MRKTMQHQSNSAVPAPTLIVLLLVLFPLNIALRSIVQVTTIFLPAVIAPYSTVTVNSTSALQTLISHIVPLLTMPAPPHRLSPPIIPLLTMPTLHTLPPRIMSLSVVSLPTMPPPLPISLSLLLLPLPANLTLALLSSLTENILSLRTIRRGQTRVCFGVRADIDAGAALVVAGLPVGDVADAHCVRWKNLFW